MFQESLSYRPFKYAFAVEAAKRQMIDLHWDVHQLDLTDDVRQYHSPGGMSTPSVSHDVNKEILRKCITLFTEMDREVAGGYARILPYVKNNEIRNWIVTAMCKEVTHQRAYATAAETFGFDNEAWEGFYVYKEMTDKLDVMSDIMWDEADRDQMKFCIGLSQVLLGEGIGLFGAFSALLNFKRWGKIIGFNDVNQWSLVDEQDHVSTNILILKEARKFLSEAENIALDKMIRKMILAYVEAEHKLIDLLYVDGDQEGLTTAEAKDYIVYLGELREMQLGLRKARDVRENPLMWMEYMLTGAKHDNFFEKRVTDYSHAKLEGPVDYTRFLHMV